MCKTSSLSAYSAYGPSAGPQGRVRSAADSDRTALPLTLASLLIANACTVIGFGVLAFARVPVLSALGATVAPGTLLALLFAALLAPRTLMAAT